MWAASALDPKSARHTHLVNLAVRRRHSPADRSARGRTGRSGVSTGRDKRQRLIKEYGQNTDDHFCFFFFFRLLFNIELVAELNGASPNALPLTTVLFKVN